MTIDELIDALNKAEGPSRELDQAVGVLARNMDRAPGSSEILGIANCREYTAGLDAALTLVPDGMEWSLTTLYGEATAEVGLNNTTGMHSTGRRKDGNVAIALCIAALRARKP